MPVAIGQSPKVCCCITKKGEGVFVSDKTLEEKGSVYDLHH
jgi:hypothetical protein